MALDVYTLKRAVEATVAALNKLPAKAKDAYATNEQLNQFNGLREQALPVVKDQFELVPPKFALAHGGALVGVPSTRM